MGPFSNNTTPPPPPDNRNKLPVPDVNAPTQSVLVESDTNFEGTKKWFTISVIIVGVVALVAAIVFGVYVYVTSTPNYMLSAAVNNFANSDGTAGNFTVTSKQGSKTVATPGDFLSYSDPTNSKQGQITFSLGQGTSRVSVMARVFDNGSYVETAGLSNIGRLIKALGGDTSKITNDKLTQLSALDNRWYNYVPADASDIESAVSQHTVQGSVPSGDILALEQLFIKNPFMSIDSQLGDETVNGANSMHLKLRVDRGKLGDYLQSAKDAHLTAITITDGDIATVRKMTDIDKMRIEVWIARSDRTFQQFKYSAPSGTDTVLVSLKPEVLATQRQSVVRPGDTESLAKLVKGLSTVLPLK